MKYIKQFINIPTGCEGNFWEIPAFAGMTKIMELHRNICGLINNKFFSFLFTAAFLLSCGAGTEKQKQGSEGHYNSNASFIVDEVTKPVNLDPIILNPKQGLNDTFTVNLSACIRDAIRKDVSIQDTRFIIEYKTHNEKLEEEVRTAKAVSDSSGCIQWEETYRYKYVKKSPWIQLDRMIKTKSHVYAGAVLIPMAVNPWLTETDKNRPAILDLRYSRDHTVLKENIFQKDGLNFLVSASKEEFPQLWASYVEVQIETDPQKAHTPKRKLFERCRDLQCQNLSQMDQIRRLLTSYSRACKNPKDELCNKRHLKLNFLIPLKLRGYDTKGEIIDNEINGGEYDIDIQLVVIPDETKEPYRLHDEVCRHRQVSLNKGQAQETRYLSLECPVRIAYFNKNATYEVFVEIRPNKKLNFKKFQGTYTFKFDFSGVKTTYTIDTEIDKKYREVLKTAGEIELFRQEDINNMYDVIIQQQAGVGQQASHSFHQPVLDGVNTFKYAHVKNTRDCKDNDNVVLRTATFAGQVCLTDTLTNNKPKQIDFRVFLEKPDTLSTNNNKAIIEEVFDFKDGQKQIFQTDQQGCIDLPVSIKHNIYNRQQYFPVIIHFLSAKFNFYAQVKAALNSWQRAFQAHHDISKLSTEAIRMDTTGVTRPNLIINQFKSVNLFPSYVLDKFLNIHLYHRVYFLFQPFIQRPDNVALGLDHRARELLRDGYYMTRLLVVRNPQETKKLNRLLTEDELNKNKKEPLNEKLEFDVSNSEYISHVDTIVPVEANFVNLYMPLYVTTKQLYYVASRNLISIEIVPVDPTGFHYKKVEEGGECELDLDKTKWRPYYDHELKNRPYIGAFNMQNWTNWNILRHAADLDSDAIIEKSKIGKKYKLFSLSRKNKEAVQVNSGTMDRAYVNGAENYKDQEPSNKMISEYTETGVHPALEEYMEEQILKDQKELITQNDKVLEEYAEQNALKILDLSTPEGDRFEKDIAKALDKLNLSPSLVDTEEILSLLPEDHKETLQKDIEEQCPNYLLTWPDEEYRRQIIRAYIEAVQNKGFDEIFNFLGPQRECIHQVIMAYIEAVQNKRDGAGPLNQQMFLSSILESIKTKSESYYDFLVNSARLGKETIMNIIDSRVNSANAENPETLIFAKALCHFWFDSYLTDYLEPDQMIGAYTNYIRKFDYYKVLETEGLPEDTKLSTFHEFLRLVGLTDPRTVYDADFASCHEEYTECIISDHCQLNFLNDVKRDYCEKIYFNNAKNSCKELVDTECKKDPSFAFCHSDLRDQKRCSDVVNNFCATNKDHSLCYKFSNRCLRGYRSCMKSDSVKDIFDVKSIVRFQCLKDPDREQKNCLKDPQKTKKECADDYYQLKNFQGRECNKYYYSSPLRACLVNPYQFFNFENKMIIHELTERSAVYREGLMRNFNVTGNFSLGSYMNWTAQRGHSLSLSEKYGLQAFGTGLDLSLSESMSSNESNSSRRAVDVRAGEGAFFAIAQAILEVDVTKFQKCLVVRPRSHAFFSHLNREFDHIFDETGLFERHHEKQNRTLWKKEALNEDFKKIFVSRPGLIICNPVEERNDWEGERIEENYYYITQNQTDPSNSQFLNLYDLANRPFMNILRGRSEFIKYYHMMKSIVEGDNGDINENLDPRKPPENMFIDYSHPVEEAAGLGLKLREFRQTGFYPGVYHYAEDSDKVMDFIYEKEGQKFTEKLFDVYRKNIRFMSIPTYPENNIPIYEEKR